MKKYTTMIATFSLLLGSLLVGATTSSPAFADAEPGLENSGAANAAKLDAARKSSLDFEDGVVEGLSRKSRDSVSQVGENGNRLKGRLYKKRTDFREELSEIYREMEYMR